MRQEQRNIFIVPFERKYKVLDLDLDTLKNPIIFSDEFWNHFTSTFPSATISIFSRRNDDYDNIIRLSDTAYSYGLISSRNQIFLQNHLPKNLSKEESNSYWEGIGFFVIPDSTTSQDHHQPEVTLERHWSKASEKVEKEYLAFFSLVTDYNKEFAIVAKRNLIDSILQEYQ